MEIGELLQYYMLNTVINFSFKNFIALWRHPRKTQVLCDAQTYLYNVNKRQKFTNFHEIRLWNFQNICNEIGWPRFYCATLYGRTYVRNCSSLYPPVSPTGGRRTIIKMTMS